MDTNSLRTFQILDALARNNNLTQRDLSKRVGVAVGLVNRYVKRLVTKGYIEVTYVEKNRLRYLLTPKGIKQKSALTGRYLQRSYRLFVDLRERTTHCFRRLAKEGVKRVVFYGTSEVAELAFLSLHSSGLELAGVVDEKPSREKFCGYPVQILEDLKNIDYDTVVVTQLDYDEKLEKNLLVHGVPAEKISWLSDSG
ncbi:MAG: winged helix-turn-helix transcriptional regulator [Thermodesulfobacteriota bacterium]